MSDVTAMPLPVLPPRDRAGHKGNYGRVLLIGGSRGMSGAIALAGMATLRSGAGLVTLAVPETCADVVAGIEPSYMTVALASDEAGRFAADAAERIIELAQAADVVACGPGLGRSNAIDHWVARLYTQVERPMVCDADALNALAWHPATLLQPGGPRVLTPHPGEFRRLAQSTSTDRAELEQLARDLAPVWQAVVVLKGNRTLIATADRFAHNSTGNPGMATGGSGDVLTGVVAALIGQGLDVFDAARLAAFVHGRAGDLAAAELGEVLLIASDLIRFLPAAFKSLPR